MLIRKFHIGPVPGTAVLAELTNAAIGHNLLLLFAVMITLVLLTLAANLFVGGLPVLLGPAGPG